MNATAFPELARFVERSLTSRQAEGTVTRNTTRTPELDYRYLLKSPVLALLQDAGLLLGQLHPDIRLTVVKPNTVIKLPVHLSLGFGITKDEYVDSDYGEDHFSWEEVNIQVARSESGKIKGLRLNSFGQLKYQGIVTPGTRPEVLTPAIEQAALSPVKRQLTPYSLSPLHPVFREVIPIPGLNGIPNAT